MSTDLQSTLKDLQDLNVNELIALNNKVKEPYFAVENKNANANVSEIWYNSARYMITHRNFAMAEICYFMAYIYDKQNVTKLQQLILVFTENNKFKQAVEYLSKLYQLVDNKSSKIFWSIVLQILPRDDILSICKSNDSDPLDTIIEMFRLDIDQPMTWLCLGYTLKSINHEILSNQAFDNAIALHRLRSESN